MKEHEFRLLIACIEEALKTEDGPMQFLEAVFLGDLSQPDEETRKEFIAMLQPGEASATTTTQAEPEDWADKLYSLLPTEVQELFTLSEWREAAPFVKDNKEKEYKSRRGDCLSPQDIVRWEWVKKMASKIVQAFKDVGIATSLVPAAFAADSKDAVPEVERKIEVETMLQGYRVTLGLYIDTRGDLIFTLRDRSKKVPNGTAVQVDLVFGDGSQKQTNAVIQSGFAAARLSPSPVKSLAFIRECKCHFTKGGSREKSC